MKLSYHVFTLISSALVVAWLGSVASAIPEQTLIHYEILPTFDAQLEPGEDFSIGDGAEELVIDGGFGAFFPRLDVLIEFPLDPIPMDTRLTSVQLTLDALTASNPMIIQVLGYEGDGLASLSDQFATTTLLGENDPPGVNSVDDVVIDLDTAFVQSLLGDGATHLGLRLASKTEGLLSRSPPARALTASRPRCWSALSPSRPAVCLLCWQSAGQP